MKLQKRVGFFCFILPTLFLCFSLFSRGTIYILDLNIDLDWINSEKSKGHYITELRDKLKRLEYNPVWIRSVKNLGDFEFLICNNLNWHHLAKDVCMYPKEKLFLFLWEPPTVLNFNHDKKLHENFLKVYTWDDSLVDNKHYFQFFYPQHGRMREPDIPFEQRKLCAMVNCNKDSTHPLSLYGERRKIINFFEQHFSDDFDLYGRGWESEGFKNYKGVVDSKFDCLRMYKFYFAYENMRDVNGYITEKIFDAFKSGCVPVYWGAKNITDYIPKECFIDRREFGSDQELYWFLKNMSEDEHQNYIDSIKRFLDSDQSLLFSEEYYIDTFLSAVEPGYDKMIMLNKWQRAIIERINSYLNAYKY